MSNAAATLIFGLVLSFPASLSADEPVDHPDCIEVTGRSQYSGYGFNHIVHLHNTCASAASCRVSTDVAPAAVNVQLAVGDATDVLTFRGSPASAFRPRAICTLASTSR